jgi:hypothetical protein
MDFGVTYDVGIISAKATDCVTVFRITKSIMKTLNASQLLV